MRKILGQEPFQAKLSVMRVLSSSTRQKPVHLTTIFWYSLDLSDLTETADRAADRGGSGRGNGPRTASYGLVAALALPDTNSATLDGVLSAKRARVAGVLGHFHLLDVATERSTIASAACKG